MRQKLNLTLPEDLIEQMKIQAVREKRAVSLIVEDLCQQYLQEQREKKAGTNKKPSIK